ncbi:hypothetical protein E2C01_069939 [Portunus trituberculatus]|uniref:Uncharacterized protein n=1 Tax=Portunus trituberculatus TaxID=210409 RepID=A0A5B7I0V6_PORTR|nr:hypothetical protein [Portunus trituberculatus]
MRLPRGCVTRPSGGSDSRRGAQRAGHGEATGRGQVTPFKRRKVTRFTSAQVPHREEEEEEKEKEEEDRL